MEQALDLLRSSSETTPVVKAQQILADLRRCLAPPGYRATIQLEENGRKKRATASSSYWGFGTGEILIFYKPMVSGPELVASTAALPEQSISVGEFPETTDEEIQQCAQALAEAEKGGKHFIAYKWFRDAMLASRHYPWAATPEGRTRVLKIAVERGAIETRKIPNPKAPSYPTTTVRLVSAQDSPVKIKPRYSPVPIKGEPASVTMLRDRGSYQLYFLESSAFVKLFVAETGSATMVSLSETTEDRFKVISALAFVEVRSAIRRRERSGELLSADADQALLALDEEARRLVEHPLNAKVMVEAAAIVDRRALRSLDALQLATAVVARELEISFRTMTFVCSDERLLEAAALEKFAVLNPEIG